MKNTICTSRKVTEVVEKWLKRSLLFYVISFTAIKILYYFFEEVSMYASFYKNAIISLLQVFGILVFVLGVIIDELLYIFHNKDKNKIIIKVLVMIIIILGGYVSLKYTNFYEYYSDLHYALNDDYCEEVQELKEIYIKKTSSSKLNTRTIYIETKESKFIASEYIVQVKDLDRFKNKFKNCKKVKIKYLPNSNKLLWIEPVKNWKLGFDIWSYCDTTE